MAFIALSASSAHAGWDWWEKNVQEPFQKWCRSDKACRNTAENICRSGCNDELEGCPLTDRQCDIQHKLCRAGCIRQPAPQTEPPPSFAAVITAGGSPRDIVHIRTDHGGDLIAVSNHASGSGGFAVGAVYATGVHLHGGEPTHYGVIDADITGDGLRDILHYRTEGGKLIFAPHLYDAAGSFHAAPLYHTGVHYNGGETALIGIIAADISGDGIDDVTHARTDSDGQLILIPHISDGTGGFAPAPIHYTGTQYGEGGNAPSNVIAGDISGDGIDDFVHARTDNGGEVILIPHISDGNGTFTPAAIYRTGVQYGEGGKTLSNVVTADVSGDGIDDIVHARTDGGGELILIPHVADGAGGFNRMPIYRTGNHFSGGEATMFGVTAKDFSGDGVDDLLHYRTDGAELILLVHISEGVSGWRPTGIYRTGVHFNGGEKTLFRVIAADVDGNGLTDVVHVRTDDNGKVILVPHLGVGGGAFQKAGIHRTQTNFGE